MKKLFAAILIAVTTLTQFAFTPLQSKPDKSPVEKAAEQTLKKQIMTEAAWAMQQQPVTVTASSSPRSAGGKHDFFRKPIISGLIPKIPTGLTSTAMA
ncbi:hypothetical protein ACQ86K_01700 [Mucilaginibacter sp. P19]|uniref:hypothetical protein n=1 Tax=Mucilaginibacter sp. P19 TaxID=3423947 RepID=UPI003D66C39B